MTLTADLLDATHCWAGFVPPGYLAKLAGCIKTAGVRDPAAAFPLAPPSAAETVPAMRAAADRDTGSLRLASWRDW
jgi:hypothetical protein